MLTCVVLALAVQPAWKGDFSILIQGTGSATSGPSIGKWKIHREARGTIVLDRSFAGAGIAGTTDSKNTERYEAWIANAKQPIEMRIHDTVTVRGPLFAKNEIRLDTFRYNCPADPATDAWQPGKVGSPILQFDRQKGTYEIEAPRFFATVQSYFKREFVEGPKAWTSKKPILTDGPALEFEIIHGLIQPKEWFKWTGPYKPGQDEIVIDRKFTFGPPLGAQILGQKVIGQIKLTLKKS